MNYKMSRRLVERKDYRVLKLKKKKKTFLFLQEKERIIVIGLIFNCMSIFIQKMNRLIINDTFYRINKTKYISRKSHQQMISYLRNHYDILAEFCPLAI